MSTRLGTALSRDDELPSKLALHASTLLTRTFGLADSAGEPLAVISNVVQPVNANIRPRSSVLVITRNDGGVIGA